MFDKFATEFHELEGERRPDDLTVLSLSTCGFCSSAKKFLAEEEITHRYLDLDTIDPEKKKKIKDEFKKKFGRRVSYPTLIIGEKRFLVGFIKKQWSEELGLEGA